MKKLFMTVALVFATTIGFADGNSSIEETTIDCIDVSLSCGVTYEICNFSGTTTQLVNSVLNSNNNVCGTDFDMVE